MTNSEPSSSSSTGIDGRWVHVSALDIEEHHELDDDDLTDVDTRVRTVIEILLENIASREQEGGLDICVSVGLGDDYVEIHAADCTSDLDTDLGVLQEEDIMNIETAGVSMSDFHLLEGFVDGYGGSMRVKTDETGAVGFTLEFPLQQSFIDDSVGIVKNTA